MIGLDLESSPEGMAGFEIPGIPFRERFQIAPDQGEKT